MFTETLLSYWFILLAIIAAVEIACGRTEISHLTKNRWVTNSALIIIGMGVTALLSVNSIIVSYWAQTQKIGIFNILDVGLILHVILSLLLISLWTYLLHVASHKIPFLWQFHKIHHSDSHLDVTTTFRNHPIMNGITLSANAIIIITFGLSPLAILIYTAIVLLMSLAQHTTITLPHSLDRTLSPFIITPALHHLHHSDFEEETNSNYGSDLALWDRIFGTYLKSSKRPSDQFNYGLKEFPMEKSHDLDHLLLAPFKNLKDTFFKSVKNKTLF